MTPVTQRRLGHGAGQCTEATIASLLDVALDEVPDLYDPTLPLGERTATWARLCDWLHERGLQAWEVRFAARPPPECTRFLPDVLAVGDALEPARSRFDGHHAIVGKNDAGIGHMVVGFRGRVVWDPNPSRTGLAEVDGFMALVPLATVDPDWRFTAGVAYTVEGA